MNTNTTALKNFARHTRVKLVSLVTTKLRYVLNADTAELRGYEAQIERLRREIKSKSEPEVIEEVAYTWFNRVMALRYMDANNYNSPKVVTPVKENMRPEILQEAMGGTVDDELGLTPEETRLPEEKLYRKLLVAVCNKMNGTMSFLFEPLTDYTELLLPDDLLSPDSFVTDIRNGMTDKDCRNVEIIGWLYQFYITDRKEDAETKKRKKGGLNSDEQAAATQLFTPHWIVRYMVENSLGRIWMTLHPQSSLKAEMPYYIDTPDGQTDVIPKDIHSVNDIRFLDPCMGSGHILVYAFDLLCKMYEEEGYMSEDIPARVLKNNIFGMDIDLRCYQLTCFALTMKARAYYNHYLDNTVPPNVIALKKVDHDTIASCGTWSTKSLIWQFENIDTIGSLLKITEEEYKNISVSTDLLGLMQKELKDQARYLSCKYHCVVTNPPYLGKGLGKELKGYIETHFPNSKADLYAAFIEHLSSMSCLNGFTAMVTMESWMFISSYKKLRKHLLSNYTFLSLSHFDWNIMRIAFGTVAFILQNKKCYNERGVYSYLSKEDVDSTNEEPSVFPNKSNGKYSVKNQKDFETIPGATIGYWVTPSEIKVFKSCEKASKFCRFAIGLVTGNNKEYVRQWYEVSYARIGYGYKCRGEACSSQKKWFPYANGGGFCKWYGNLISVVDWENDGERLQNTLTKDGKRIQAHNFNLDRIFKEGLSWNAICSTSAPSFREVPTGCLFDAAAGLGQVIDNKTTKAYMIAFLNSKVFLELLRIINPTCNVPPGYIGSLPFKLDNIDKIQSASSDSISISKRDWNAHETSWDFQVNELVRMAHATAVGNTCQEDIALSIKSLVEKYKEEWTGLFRQLHCNEEELNRQFIDIYGLQNELTSDVPLNEVTILQKGEISIEENQLVWHDDVLIKQLISYLVGCFMGRYSVDKPGLIIASQGMSIDSLNMPKRTLEIDDDAIIPIISEPDFFTDDMAQRIEKAVRILFGESTFHDNMLYIANCLRKDLRDYLYSDFYNEHIKMYTVKSDRRPIYWLFSSKMDDKKKTGCFKALVYMHRLKPDTLSLLHSKYVLPYRYKLEQQLREANDETSRDELSTAARNRAIRKANKLQTKVREVCEYETKLVEMASQRLSIDLDDGVRINYPKYYPLVERIKGLDSADE